jgi:hypothetical protein
MSQVRMANQRTDPSVCHHSKLHPSSSKPSLQTLLPFNSTNQSRTGINTNSVIMLVSLVTLPENGIIHQSITIRLAPLEPIVRFTSTVWGFNFRHAHLIIHRRCPSMPGGPWRGAGACRIRRAKCRAATLADENAHRWSDELVPLPNAPASSGTKFCPHATTNPRWV